MFQNKKYLYLVLLAVLTCVLSYVFFGFYYERYEPFLVAFMSGIFTPGMVYNDLFYLAHIIIIKLYAGLFTIWPNISWLSWIQTLYLIISYIILGKILVENMRFKNFIFFPILLFSVFFMEFHVIHVMTRISYLLSFAALLKLMYNYEAGTKEIRNNLLYFALFGLAVLIRSEPPSVVLLISSAYYFIVLNKQNILTKTISSIRVFIVPLIFCSVAILWVALSIKYTQEFYIKIEPEVEYELTARNNIVPIEMMTNRVDSLRYEAVYLGVWGDASTNDADFLRSLISSKEVDFNYMFSNAISGIKHSAQQCKPIVFLNLFLFLFLFTFFLFKDRSRAFGLLIFHCLFYFVIFLFSYKVKMIVTSLSPLMFIVSIAYLIAIYNLNKKASSMLISLFSIFLVFFQFWFLKNIASEKNAEYLASRAVIEVMEDAFEDKNILFDEKSFHFTMKGFRPFKKLEFNKVNKVYAFDNQHTSTIQPYKKYLAEDCSCDPNNYQEFFQFILTHSEENVFFIDSSKAVFYEEYLSVVHGLQTNWIKLPLEEEQTDKLRNIEECAFYRIERAPSL